MSKYNFIQKGNFMKSKCSNCGQEFEGDLNFCPKCGKPIETGNKTVTCPKCGYSYESDYSFCPKCGEKTSVTVDDTSIVEVNSSAPKEEKVVEKKKFNLNIPFFKKGAFKNEPIEENNEEGLELYQQKSFQEEVRKDVYVRIAMFGSITLFILLYIFIPFLVENGSDDSLVHMSFFKLAILNVKDLFRANSLGFYFVFITIYSIVILGFTIYYLVKEIKKIQDIEEASRSTYELVSKKDEDVVKSYIRKTERANQLLNKNRLFYNAVSGLFLLTILMIIFNNMFDGKFFYEKISGLITFPILFFILFVVCLVIDFFMNRNLKKIVNKK